MKTELKINELHYINIFGFPIRIIITGKTKTTYKIKDFIDDKAVGEERVLRYSDRKECWNCRINGFRFRLVTNEEYEIQKKIGFKERERNLD